MVSQQPGDIGAVGLRRHEQRRDAVSIHVVHGGLWRELEYHLHNFYVPARGRHYERHALVAGVLEARPAQVEFTMQWAFVAGGKQVAFKLRLQVLNIP